MITIPTGDLTGILSDVLPFASPDDDDPVLHTVLIEWDGQMMHALASDRFRFGWSSWHPDDEPDEEVQDDLFTDWGGADEPWSLIIPLDDAKHLVKAFKLGNKELRTPVQVDGSDQQIKVHRSKETGHSDLTAVVQAGEFPFPDVKAMLAAADTVEPVANIRFTAKYLADFAKVRPRGPLELTFTGAAAIALVSIGERFSGAIMPIRGGAAA